MEKSFSGSIIDSVEAILFSYGDWVSVDEICSILENVNEAEVKKALKFLKDKFSSGFSFIVEVNENKKWRMALKSEFEEIVSKVVHNIEIPREVLKVLSVIAYEQPITKTRLSEIIGKSVKKEVNWLYRNKFLSYEKRGNGRYYRVTRKFYDYFKLVDEEEFREKAKDLNLYLDDFINES